MVVICFFQAFYSVHILLPQQKSGHVVAFFFLDLSMCCQKPGKQSDMDLGMQNIRATKYTQKQRIVRRIIAFFLFSARPPIPPSTLFVQLYST